ncbi:MAG: SDR family oxidoreductase [Bacteroidales bacterium]|nr:SDR family oxidoreductase [Bacteroidales bacterium]
MDLNLKSRLFLIGGATAGFGNAVARALIAEGAVIIAVARNIENLQHFKSQFPNQIEAINGDITDSEIIDEIVNFVGSRKLDGVLINAGGPPAKSALETTLEDWDLAWFTLVRWKIDLVLKLIPKLREQKYGRLLFVESVSVKQPIENLVLSNSLRMALVGFAKTLSNEVGRDGITVNILAPGYHQTEAVKRVLTKKSEISGLSYAEVQQNLENNIPVGRMGSPDDFASLAAWLLSPQSGYVSGQTISVDGGVMRGSFG